MYHLIRPDLNLNIVGNSKPFVWASTVLVIVSVILLFKPGLNFGIDFTGGAEVAVEVPASWDTGKLRTALATQGLGEATVIKVEDGSRNEFMIKTQILEGTSTLVENAIRPQILPGEKFEILKADVVGPQAGTELRISAIISILIASLGILIYVTFRFDFRFAPGIVRALVFDVIVTLGVWAAFGKEFNLSTVAALLTIAGYSCNDTIVIYDRIRDYMRQYKDRPFEEIVNHSLNINLGRTVLTTLSTNFVVVSLWWLGGPVLGDFAFAMFVGFTISIFSAIFVASPLVIYMEKRRLEKEKAAGAIAAQAVAAKS
jgi:preprotein translocase subunit SecF